MLVKLFLLRSLIFKPRIRQKIPPTFTRGCCNLLIIHACHHLHVNKIALGLYQLLLIYY